MTGTSRPGTMASACSAPAETRAAAERSAARCPPDNISISAPPRRGGVTSHLRCGPCQRQGATAGQTLRRNAGAGAEGQETQPRGAAGAGSPPGGARAVEGPPRAPLSRGSQVISLQTPPATLRCPQPGFLRFSLVIAVKTIVLCSSAEMSPLQIFPFLIFSLLCPSGSGPHPEVARSGPGPAFRLQSLLWTARPARKQESSFVGLTYLFSSFCNAQSNNVI